jgi:cyanophycinase
MKKILLTMFVCLFSSFAAEGKITRYLSGNGADVQPVPAGPVLNLGGGGTDVDAALQWMIDKARGCTNCATKVDVVVLRASGSNGYNDYILAMNGVDSVESIVITSKKDATNAALSTTIRNAEVVFFAGGDQCDYVTIFKGTPIETAVEFVYARGGAVGGTSAGLAIQGEYVYDGCRASAVSSDALANPFHSSLTFTYNFFNWNDLQTVITDSHFQQRDRMGRLMAFLARQIRDGKTAAAWGVAGNEVTSIVVDQNGLATVMGSGNAYFVYADHPPEVCEPNQPLTFSNFKIWRVAPNQTFNLRNRPTTGFYSISVSNGQLSGNPY